MTIATLADHAALVRALAAALPAEQVIETHISSVLLAGEHALKLKKPVALDFLDFSTLDARRRFCDEELRLNRRTAPQLYLDVLPVTGTVAAPRLGGAGAVLDWALRMRRFDPALTLDRCVERLDGAQIDALAVAIAALHRGAAVVPADSDWGRPDTLRRTVDDNLAGLRADCHAPALRARADALAAWCTAGFAQQRALIETRRAQGFVRECHGDLHLGNVVLIDGAPLLFDALEFSAELRWIDVIGDLAFTFMDLLDHRRPRLAWRLASAWLERSGDYGGAPLLRWWAVHRALVRARIALLRSQQAQAARRERLRAQTRAARYLTLAETLTRPPPPCLLLMSGLSGSGKSVVAAELAARCGGLRLRADVERKRRAGLTAEQRGPAALYTPEMNAATYARLAELAGDLLEAGFTVVVDAACLRAAERRMLARVAQQRGLPVVVVDCVAPVEVLRARVEARARVGADASDATRAVLDRQLDWIEAPAADEPPHWRLGTDRPLPALLAACARLAHKAAALAR